MATEQQQVTIEHEKGLHARPASLFVRTASEFDCEIEVGAADAEERVNAKSSIRVMSLGIESGDEIVIVADGDNSERAVERLVTLVEDDFEQ
jgi:phosphocarrier protein